ncbi:MAG: hypothetical protein U0103_25045 [Candidatus Obscuribacterales bacterium]
MPLYSKHLTVSRFFSIGGKAMTNRHLDDSSNAHQAESHGPSHLTSDNSGDQNERHDHTGTAQSIADKWHAELPWFRRPMPANEESQTRQTALKAERIRKAEEVLLLVNPLTNPFGATFGAGVESMVELSKHYVDGSAERKNLP